MNVVNRPSSVLKRRYLDYLKKLGFDLNRPEFEFLINLFLKNYT